jgi:hypothetical protein
MGELVPKDLSEFDNPLTDAAQERVAQVLASDLWEFGQTGESEISFARRFLSKRWVDLVRHPDGHFDKKVSDAD